MRGRTRCSRRRVQCAAALAGAALTALLGGEIARGGGTAVRSHLEPGEALFGWGVAALGDVNDDGTADYAVGASGAADPSFSSAGSLSVYSGVDGALLYRLRGDRNSQRLGTSIASIGDLDGDDRAEFVVGAPGTSGPFQPLGHARVCSGLDGSEIRRVTGATGTLRFGEVVANVGDLTGDGKADFAVGAPGVTGSTTGVCRVFSSADGSEILALAQTGPTPGSNLGHAIAALGDVNGDGKPDFAVGAPGSDPKRKGRLHIGEVIVVSGADGAVIRRHTGKKTGERFGHALAPAGDQDGDGVTDLLVGATGTGSVGAVTVWSGRTGKPLVVGPLAGGAPNSRFGSSVAALGDIDGDGRPEVAVGASDNSGGEVTVFGTKSRLPIYIYRGAANELAGDFLAAIGDVDGDQRPELLLGGWGGTLARVVSVDAAAIPVAAAIAAKVTLQVPAAASGPQKGSVLIKVKGVVQSVTFQFKGLPAATTAYTLELEDGPSAGTYKRIANVTVVSGKATVALSSKYLPPGPLGVATLAQLSGRRVELRDGANVVLEVTLP